MDNEELEYTESAWESLYNTVDDEEYAEHDAKVIYKTLEECIKRISFGDYLKRYIYRKTKMKIPFSEVSISDYQQIIKDSFEENYTPKGFTENTTKLSALSKNWLTQQTVRRKVVFLLGFGLNMSVDDVNMFLNKGICESSINPKDPFEVICWYCYQNGYNFLKYEKLTEKYNEMSENSPTTEEIYSDYTMGLRSNMNLIHDDTALMVYLKKLRTNDKRSKISRTATDCFTKLYNEARVTLAEYYEFTGDDTKPVKPEDIGPGNFEDVLYAAVPKDRNGNLSSARLSKLNELFSDRRFTRQHIHGLLQGTEDVTRFDLLTLNFLIYARNRELEDNPTKRYSRFVDSTNEILAGCFMGKIYVQNPYECFILMCILSEDPLCTYAEVWEMSL